MIPHNLIARIYQCDDLNENEKIEVIDSIIAECNSNLPGFHAKAQIDSDASYIHSFIKWSDSKRGFDYWKHISDIVDNNQFRKLKRKSKRFNMSTTKRLIDYILRSNLPQQDQQRAISHIHMMYTHPYRATNYGYDEHSNVVTKLFCWDRAPEGGAYWVNIFKHLNLKEDEKVKEEVTQDSTDN